MLRLFKHFLITTLFVSQSVFATQGDVSAAQDLYIDLLSNQTQNHEVKKICEDITDLLFSERGARFNYTKGDKELKEDLNQFLKIIETTDLDEVIENQNLTLQEKQEYLHQLKNRIVALSFAFSQSVKSKKLYLAKDAVLVSYLEGVFIGVVIYMSIKLPNSLTNTALGQNPNLIGIALGTGVGVAGTYNLIVTNKKYNNLNEYRKDFEKVVETNIKKLKGSELDKTVNELE